MVVSVIRVWLDTLDSRTVISADAIEREPRHRSVMELRHSANARYGSITVTQFAKPHSTAPARMRTFKRLETTVMLENILRNSSHPVQCPYKRFLASVNKPNVSIDISGYSILIFRSGERCRS